MRAKFWFSFFLLFAFIYFIVGYTLYLLFYFYFLYIIYTAFSSKKCLIKATYFLSQKSPHLSVISETYNETYTKPANLRQWLTNLKKNPYATFITNNHAMLHRKKTYNSLNSSKIQWPRSKSRNSTRVDHGFFLAKNILI